MNFFKYIFQTEETFELPFTIFLGIVLLLLGYLIGMNQLPTQIMNMLSKTQKHRRVDLE